MCIQTQPAVALSEVSEPLSPSSVRSDGNEQETFVDCDSRRTDSSNEPDEPSRDETALDEPSRDKTALDEPSSDEPVLDERSCDENTLDKPSHVKTAVDAPAQQAHSEQVLVNESRTEELELEVELESESVSTLERLQSAESVESGVSGASVTDNLSVGSRSVSEAGRRTSVIDPPSGFQTSTPSSKEDLDVVDVVLNVAQTEPVNPPVVEVAPWSRSSDLRNSTKLFRGQSVDVSIAILTIVTNRN